VSIGLRAEGGLIAGGERKISREPSVGKDPYKGSWDQPEAYARDDVGLVAGIERRDEFVVEGPLLTDVGGTIGASVLSTPAMVGLIERTSAILAFERLPEGKATVGFEVCVKHVAAAPEGSTCVVTSRLREVEDGRKLHFDVEVKKGERTIGVGTHQRRVIDVGALGNR
jgi:fluoroacetyl-CoA thioesterase